jgi:hypothetical protein
MATVAFSPLRSAFLPTKGCWEISGSGALGELELRELVIKG